MIGTINDPNVTAEVGGAFGTASVRARERMQRALVRERQGQAGIREETFTEDLLDEMEKGVRERLHETSEVLSKQAPSVRIEFEASKAPQGEENDFGLDLGISVSIESPGYTIRKAILVQCKRMYGSGSNGTFPKLRGDGEKQAEDMLKITPAAFFFLFNGGSPAELWELMRPHGYELFPWDWFLPELPAFDSYFDPGIVVMPATRVLALSEAASSFPTKAKDILPGTTPLGQFIAELFAPCIVGDPRTGVIQLATAPSLRAGVEGLDANIPDLPDLKARRFHRLKITNQPSEGDTKRRWKRKR